MDCREFRQKHLAFVDDTLAGIELVEMQRHALECDVCARHDAMVRRSLIVLRSLPPVEPSPDFTERLNARLRALGPIDRRPPALGRAPGVGSFVAVAASIIAAGYLAVSTINSSRPSGDIVLPPVVASRPAVPASPTASAAIVASMPTVVPVWPAVFLAQQAPIHLVSAEFQGFRGATIQNASLTTR